MKILEAPEGKIYNRIETDIFSTLVILGAKDDPKNWLLMTIEEAKARGWVDPDEPLPEPKTEEES